MANEASVPTWTQDVQSLAYQVGPVEDLADNRLGDRPREIGVHVTPTDFTAEELKEVLARCKQLWNEKTLARLAVPEMLE
jgi:hypothetical protein